MYAQPTLRMRRNSIATNRIFIAVLFLAAIVLVVLTFTLPSHAQAPQQQTQQQPATGESHPPADTNYQPSDNDPEVTYDTTQPKPSAAHYDSAPTTQTETVTAAPQAELAPANTPNIQSAPAVAQTKPNFDPDSMIVGDPMPAVEATHPAPQQLSTRPTAQPATQNDPNDPDGKIVGERVAAPGEIIEGTTIRVRLLDRLSSANTEQGTPFRSTVASDVIANGQILIPAGAQIDGTVVKVSAGEKLASKGYLRLHPETVTLPDGSKYHIDSTITGTPGSNTKVGDEGTIKAGSRMRRDEVEYGGVVTAGVVTGAIVAGPVGALTGGAVGAGVVTTHLLVNHPQAVLEPGTYLLITLNSPLRMNPVVGDTSASVPAVTTPSNADGTNAPVN